MEDKIENKKDEKEPLKDTWKGDDKVAKAMEDVKRAQDLQ